MLLDAGMGETLASLQRLQTVEQKRAVIRRNLEAKMRQVEAKRKNQRKIEERLKENRQSARELQMKIDSLSLDVAVREDAVSKHRDALNKAKTNKEYAAILSAMNTEKADTSKQETEVLKLMDQIRLIQEAGALIESELAKAASEVSTAEQAAAAYERDCQGELNRLQADRDQWGGKIAASAMAVFQRIAERHEGEALAAVTKPFPKKEEFACSGCNMKVALDVVNALRTRDELLTCKVCGRILYLEGNTTEARA